MCKILIIGMPDLLLECLRKLLQARKNIVGVITSPPDDPSYELAKNFLAANNLYHIAHNKNFKDETLLNIVRELEPDIAIVCSFNFLLPKELYSIPKLGTVNIHPSLLPDYRGANPYFHVINNGEKYTGVTFHHIDETFDTGDIIFSEKIEIQPKDTMGTLFNKINFISARKCLELIEMVENGIELPAIEQDQECPHIAPKIYNNSPETFIDWTRPAVETERFVRALNPFFGALTFYNGIILRIWSGRYFDNINAKFTKPGEIFKVTDKMIMVATGRGVYIPEIVNFGTYMISDIKDFIELTRIKAGDCFTAKQISVA
ncbi:MAG: methionyl-tRNA formyltransferase [Candidatus Gastranaerophilales bacterium]|nr:methionyl-tRNA formyltransferase [Candidatus Gastranaerophilales bacterium]